MKAPHFLLRAGLDEAPLPSLPEVRLRVVRVACALSIGPAVFGFARAQPIIISDSSAATPRRLPLIDLQALLSLVITLWLKSGRRRAATLIPAQRG